MKKLKSYIKKLKKVILLIIFFGVHILENGGYFIHYVSKKGRCAYHANNHKYSTLYSFRDDVSVTDCDHCNNRPIITNKILIRPVYYLKSKSFLVRGKPRMLKL